MLHWTWPISVTNAGETGWWASSSGRRQEIATSSVGQAPPSPEEWGNFQALSDRGLCAGAHKGENDPWSARTWSCRNSAHVAPFRRDGGLRTDRRRRTIGVAESRAASAGRSIGRGSTGRPRSARRACARRSYTCPETCRGFPLRIASSSSNRLVRVRRDIAARSAAARPDPRRPSGSRARAPRGLS